MSTMESVLSLGATEMSSVSPTASDNVTEQDEYWDRLPFGHKYWHQFNIRDIPVAYHYALSGWMTFFGIFGVLGNLIVIVVFVKSKILRTPGNMLIINLAFSDMMFSALNGFPLFTISSINRIWSWGKLWCELYAFAGGLFGLISIITLAFIAIDRYRVISDPMKAFENSTKKKSLMYIVITWVWAGLWALPPFFGWGGYIPDGFQTSCTYDYLTQTMNNYSHIISMYVCTYFVPIAIIIFCYTVIVQSVRSHYSEMKKTASKMGATMSKADMKQRDEIRVAKVSAISVGSFLLSWTPYATITALGMFFPHEAKFLNPYMCEIPVMFAKASAAYNPVIYSLSHPKFRTEIKRYCPWLCCCKPDTVPAHAMSSSTRVVGMKAEVSATSDTVDFESIEISQTVNPAVTTSEQ